MNQRLIQGASLVIIISGLYLAKTFFVTLFLAVLLCFLMLPFLHFLIRKRFPEWLALFMSAVVLCLPLFLLSLFSIKEIKMLAQESPQIISSVKEIWDHFSTSDLVARLGLSDTLDLTSLQERFSENSQESVTLVVHGMKTVAEASAHFFIVLFFSILMLAGRNQMRASIEKIILQRNMIEEVIGLIEKFLLARIGIALGVTFLDMFILRLFGTPYSILLGIALGLATAIPILGFLAAIIPVIILSLVSGHSFGILGAEVLVLYGVAFIESHFVAPQLLGKQLNLNLLVTFIGLLGGEMLWGIWGMVLSIPLLGVLRIIATHTGYHSWSILLEDRKKDDSNAS